MKKYVLQKMIITYFNIDDNHLSNRGAEFVIDYLYKNKKFNVK